MTKSPSSINWQRARETLRKSELALQSALFPDETRIHEVFQRRATMLAQRPASQHPSTSATSCLVFYLGEARYAIELCDVAEVGRIKHWTWIPGSPPELAGLMNWRGELKAMINLHRVLDLPTSDEIGASFYVLIRKSLADMCFRVDRIDEIQFICKQELQTPQDIMRCGARFALGVHGDGTILLRADEISARVNSLEYA